MHSKKYTHLLAALSLLFLLGLPGCGTALRLTVQALRKESDQPITLNADDRLRVGDRFAMKVTTTAPAYLYALEGATLRGAKLMMSVASVTAKSGTVQIPDDDYLLLDPLPPGTTQRREQVFVVASRTPLSEAEVRAAARRAVPHDARSREEDSDPAATDAQPQPKPAEPAKEENKPANPPKNPPPQEGTKPVEIGSADIRGPIRLEGRLSKGHPTVLHFNFSYEAPAQGAQ